MNNSNLQVLSQALNKANQAGVFNLNESAMVLQALNGVAQEIKMLSPKMLSPKMLPPKMDESAMLKESPLDQARRESRATRGSQEVPQGLGNAEAADEPALQAEVPTQEG